MTKKNIFLKRVCDLTDLEKCVVTQNWRNSEIPDDLSIEEYIIRCYLHNPQSYGTLIANKIIELCDGKLYFSSPRDDRGDADMNHKDLVEIKSSFESDKGTHRITHIRPYHNIKNYLLVFITSDFKIRFFLIPSGILLTNNHIHLNAMNGTARTNRVNVHIEQATTIKSSDVDRLFGHNNILRGTTYNDFKEYVDYYSSKPKKVKKSVVVSPVTRMTTTKINTYSVGKSGIKKRADLRKRNKKNI